MQSPSFFDAVPPLGKLDPEDCLVSWELFITTKATENDLRDIFIFVEDYAKIALECLELRVEADAA